MYPFRTLSISISVFSATDCFALMSSLVTLDWFSVTMAVSFSKILPSPERISKIWSSISFNFLLFSAPSKY